MAMEGSSNRPAGVWLRVIDPATGQPVPLIEEERLAHAAAEQARLAAELRADAAELHADEEQQARLAAEVELRALRAALAQRGTADPDSEAHPVGQGE